MVGVGPHPQPWPVGSEWDRELLAEGDRRNVADHFRYLTVEAIRVRLDADRSALHVAIENWQHDLNIGSIVRSANAFNVAGVHIVGRRDWNRRGAMVTDRYLHVHHHPDLESFADWAREHEGSEGHDHPGLPIIGIDNIAGSTPLESAVLPRSCMMLFGQEGPGLSEEAAGICEQVLAITQYGSTRSINASAAGAVAMFAWALQHRQPEGSATHP